MKSVIILVIKQMGLPLRGRPILLISRMITDRIGLHSVLLPLHNHDVRTAVSLCGTDDISAMVNSKVGELIRMNPKRLSH